MNYRVIVNLCPFYTSIDDVPTLVCLYLLLNGKERHYSIECFDIVGVCLVVLTRRCNGPPPGGGTPIYGLYRYVLRDWVGFLRFLILKLGISFATVGIVSPVSA